EAAVALIGVGIVAVVWRFPTQALWILGDNYSGLGSEVVTMAAAASAGLVGGALFSLCTSRGMIPPWYLGPAFGIVLTGLLVATLDLSMVGEVMKFNLLLNLGWVAYNNIVFLRYSRREKAVVNG